ncbi:hypothetical protein AAG906_038419 [Vitis piasezkii]
MFESKSTSTLGIVGQNLSKHDGDPFHDVTLYRSTVGALQYLTLTRLDISFVVNKACQFMSSPSNTHWLGIKCILCYLKGTTSYGLSMQPSSSLNIQAYTDANWASYPNDKRSTNGYCIFIRPNLVSWSFTKHKVVSRSNTESEYRGIAIVASEITWIQSLLTELCLSPSPPLLMWCDNQSAAHFATNPTFHA